MWLGIYNTWRARQKEYQRLIKTESPRIITALNREANGVKIAA